MHEKPKPLSGAARARLRVERGLPRHSAETIAKMKARDARRVTERTAANFEYVTRLKLERGCADCGYNAHAAALDFDHLPGTEKRRGISRMVQSHRNTLLRELAKCEVVCSNCHRIRTWRRNRDLANEVQAREAS